MHCLISVFKKNGGAEKSEETSEKILGAIAIWTEAWKRDDWRFVPGRVTDWLYDNKWLEDPRKKEPGESRDPLRDVIGEDDFV